MCRRDPEKKMHLRVKDFIKEIEIEEIGHNPFIMNVWYSNDEYTST